MKLPRKITLFTLLFITYLTGYAQKPSIELGYDFIFDNREYFSSYAEHKTIFGGRLNSALLFSLDTIHSFAAGINYMHEYGSDLNGVKPQINLYYQYNTEKFTMLMGSFPRKNRVIYPNSFLNDTLNYYRPNIEGAFISYTDQRWGTVNGFIDWTSRITYEQRETFLIGINSVGRIGPLFVKPAAIMMHNAKSKNPADSIPLQDNGIMSITAGVKIGSSEDSFFASLSTGILASYNRYRPADFQWGRGIINDITVLYNIWGIHGVCYLGSPIHFDYGDPFYRSGKYGRLDIFVNPFKHKKITSKIGWNFHFVRGEGIHNSQQVLISVVI